MGAEDNIEKILRSLHVLLSKSEPYAKEPSKVIVDKQQMLDLLTALNKSVYDIMDEYELTEQSKARAMKEFQKKGDEIVQDASHKAEDVYAASVMYTDEVLNRVQEIMKDADTSIAQIYADLDKKLKEEEQLIKKNQLELKSSLQDLLDTEKYLKLIEDRNRELQREKKNAASLPTQEPNIYANRHTGIKINQEYFEKMGFAFEDEIQEEKKEPAPEVDIKINLDADYFQWVEEKNTEKKNKTSKEKNERFSNVLKGFTSGRKEK